MAVIQDPNLASQVAQVGMGAGTVWTPQHVTAGPLPVGTGGAYRLSMVSGTMAAALAANSEIFQFRYVTGASRVCLVHGIFISAGANVAATAAAITSLRATVARAWTAAGSGGTRATLTGNLQKLSTAHTTSEVADAGISTTGALTVGTKTLDTQDIGGVSIGIGTGAITTAVNLNLLPKTALFDGSSSPSMWPLILANQEGFVVRSGIIFPATMTWAFTIDVIWSEVQSF